MCEFLSDVGFLTISYKLSKFWNRVEDIRELASTVTRAMNGVKK